MKVLIVSDLHANWPALNAVWSKASDVDQIVCLGDVVNYGPNPAECVNWVQSNGTWTVQGNHDHAFGADADPCCSEPYRVVSAAMQRTTAGRLSLSQKRFLATLPDQIATKIGGGSWFLCHAVPSNPRYGYCLPDAGLKRWLEEVELAGNPDYLMVGHTHLPFVALAGRTTIVNPGSVGQPKDHDARASYAIWQDGRVTLHRAAYDVGSAVRELGALAPPAVAKLLSCVLQTGGSLSSPISLPDEHQDHVER